MNIIDFARNQDRSGQRFYTELAERTAQRGPRRIFRMFAGDEQRLLARLQRIEQRRGGDVDSAALADGVDVFRRLRRRIDRCAVDSDIAAYRLALDAETAVVQQYEQALDAETDPEAKRLLQRITDQERRERDEIEQLLTFVSAPQHYLEWGEFSNLGEFHNFGRDVDRL